MSGKRRDIVLSPQAEADLANIAAWTAEQFGARQADLYVDALAETIEELAPDAPHARSKARPEIGADVRSLHMMRRGRRGRHFLLYLQSATEVTILRILHDSMELSRHMPEA
jgi:toxin ParE1/3/4